VTVSKRPRRILWTVIALAIAAPAVVRGQNTVLELRAAVVGDRAPSAATLRIEVLRWSTEAERAPMLAALSAPPAPAAPAASQVAAPPPAAASPAPPAAGGRGGRGGRGGGGGGRGTAPATPQARLSAAVKAAPTIGFVWADGPTGYSIKYAWQSGSTDASRRIVLVTDRRIGAYQPLWPSTVAPAGDAEFTVIELHVDAAHNGEAKTSLVSEVIADPAAKTIALARYGSAPVQLRIIK
jgi:hypothetical protein